MVCLFVSHRVVLDGRIIDASDINEIATELALISADAVGINKSSNRIGTDYCAVLWPIILSHSTLALFYSRDFHLRTVILKQPYLGPIGADCVGKRAPQSHPLIAT